MKKKFVWVIGILVVLALLATLIGPGVILTAVKQPEPAESYAYRDSFYTSYEDIRSHLQQLSGALGAESYSHAID